MSRLITYSLGLLSMVTPAMADEVNIYSYREPELIAPLTEAFTQETGIEVNVAYLSKGMVERLKAEGRRSPADVILTVDISRLGEIVGQELTQPVASATMEALVPEAYRDPNGHWYGVTTRARVIYASKERVAPSDITTYEDLADPKWQGRICTRSGTHAYNVALTSAVMAHHGTDGARAWLKGIKENLARKPQGNDRAQVKAIWAGECDIAIGNTYYMGKMLQDEEQQAWASSVNVLFPTFENAGTHVNISGVAMAKHAPNSENALKLMEFLTSTAAQEIYAKANFEYPIAPNAMPDPLVQSWGSFTADDINLMELAKLRKASINLIEEVGFDQ